MNKKKDRSRAEIPYAITPMSLVYPYVWPENVREQIHIGDRLVLEGVQPHTKGEVVEKAMAFLSEVRYSLPHLVLMSIGSGIWQSMTRDGHYGDAETVLDPQTGNLTHVLKIPMSELWQHACGPCVNHNGRSVVGCGAAVKHVKDIVRSILSGHTAVPVFGMSDNLKEKGRSVRRSEQYFGHGPIIDIQCDGNYSVTVRMSATAFPMKSNQKGSHGGAGGPYVTHVRGLPTVLSFGRHLASQRHKEVPRFPTVIPAHRLITVVQAACERWFAGGAVAKAARWGFKLSLGRQWVGNLLPEAERSTGGTHFKAFDHHVGLVATEYQMALTELGLADDLPGGIVLPVQTVEEAERLAPRAVLIEADRNGSTPGSVWGGRDTGSKELGDLVGDKVLNMSQRVPA